MNHWQRSVSEGRRLTMKPVPEMRTITSCLETPSTMTAWYCFASSDDTGGTSSGSKSIELRLSKGWLVQLARVFLELARGLVKLVRIKDGRWRQESKPEDAYPQTGALLGGGWAVCLNPFVALRGRRDGQTGPTDGSPPLGGKCGTGRVMRAHAELLRPLSYRTV